MPVESYRTKNNQRVDASQITTFLCFTCGDMFPSNVEYQHHLLLHQAVSLSTQLYYLEHLQNNKKEKRESTEAAVEPRSPVPAAEITGRRHTAPTSVERRASLELPPRRERLPTNEEDMRKLKKPRKPVERKKPRESYGYTEPQAKKQKITPLLASDDNLIAFDEREGHLELIPQELSCPQCKDNPTFRFPIQALSHCINEHGATVVRVDIQFFNESTLVYTKDINDPGKECMRCEISIPNKTLSHLHILEKHVASMVELLMNRHTLENITSIIGSVVVAKMGTQPESTIRFSANISNQ